jgi:hypothetical protein
MIVMPGRESRKKWSHLKMGQGIHS